MTKDGPLWVMEQFLKSPLDELLSDKNLELSEASLLTHFKSTSEHTPAYRSFLKEHGIDSNTVCTIEDFQRLPCINKENYIQRYSLPYLCRNGSLANCDMMAVSSGSTGKPTFWPRALSDELAIATRFEQVFHDSFRADERSTLAVVCFALGTWVGGMYTAACCRHLATKGYPILAVTPGNNREEIFRVVQELGPHFDQTVLLGYPPFLKDVIDTGISRGVDWPSLKIKLVMAGEVFSEEWRTLVGQRTGSEQACCDSASLYGTADAGVLGNETPLSICIRRWLAENPAIARELFGESRLPTLVQYDPSSRYFEMVDGHLVFSGDNGIPLVRYDILDTGGLISYEEMMRFTSAHSFNPVQVLASARGIRPLPFAWVFGRSNFTVSYFGANVYPENISIGLEQPHISLWVTGKFVMQSLEDEDHNRTLSIVVELAPDQEADDARQALLAESVLTQLLRLNSEFANYVPAEYRTPKLTLLPFGHPEYFPVGVKHRYTRR